MNYKRFKSLAGFNMGRHTKEAVSKIFFTALMLWLGIVMVLPFLWMLSTSFKFQGDVYKFPIEWIPARWNFNNYVEVWLKQNPSFYIYYLNSIRITVICVLGELLTSSLAAYGFARLEFRGRDKIFLLYLGTMMIPFQVLIVPRFILFRWLGIYNTHLALILPGIFTTLGVFLLRQFFLTIPFELSDAARIDGASEIKIYKNIVLPISKPALASLAILAFVWRWNDYESPLIFLTTLKLYTIPLALTNFINDMNVQQDTLIMAAAVSALLPIMIVFIAGQRYFIEGLTAGSIKG